jgi:phosphoribosylformimino-5-aminoimidazole carboxamide ribotide isomerase
MNEASGFVVLPAIDLRGGRVVRLQQGDFARETAYSDDPVEVATRFADAGAQWLHVVDLDGARTGSPGHAGVIEAIVSAVGDGVSVEVGGGLRDEVAVATVLELGAARAVVGTTALRDPAFAHRLVDAHGPNRIALAIDIREGRAVGQGWSDADAGVDVAEAIDRLAKVGIATFEVTAIERDGLLDGPDLSLYERVVGLDRGSVIASGGISSPEDLERVRAAGCSGAIVGRALYERRLDLKAVLATLSRS